MSPTATACSPAASARITAPSALGCTVIPMSGGKTERQVQLISDFQPDIIMVHAELHARAPRRASPRPGIDPRATSLKIGIFGAEPWTERDAQRDRGRASTSHAIDIYGLSEVIGPGVAQECVETKDGLHIWEDHFLPGDHRPRDRRAGARRRARRAGLHLADQGSHPGHPLPHARPHPPAARHARGPACAAWRRSPAAPTT